MSYNFRNDKVTCLECGFKDHEDEFYVTNHPHGYCWGCWAGKEECDVCKEVAIGENCYKGKSSIICEDCYKKHEPSYSECEECDEYKFLISEDIEICSECFYRMKYGK